VLSGVTIGFSGRLALCGFSVTLGVERHKEEEEGDENEFLEPEDEGFLRAGEEAKTADIRHGEDRDEAIDELNELGHGEVLFPSRGSVDGSHEVGPVHEGVNESVSDNTVVEEEHASLEVGQSERGDNGVMVDMQHQQGRFSHHNEGRIQKFVEF